MGIMVVEMKQGRFIATVLAATVSPLMMGHAVAQELSFQPRVSIGYQSYDFDIDDEAFDFEGGYLLGGLGLTVQRGRFFFDLYGQTSLTEPEDDVDDVLIAGANTDRQSKADRNEINATLGYAITQGISLFGGLKYAKTEIDSDFVDVNNDQISVDIEIDYFGPFLGASYAIPIADIGALAVSGSVAYLDGKTNIAIESDVLGLDEDDDTDGTSIGANLGAAWIGSLAPLSPNFANLGYTAGLDYSYYNFEDDGDDQFEEETLRFKVDLKYSF